MTYPVGCDLRPEVSVLLPYRDAADTLAEAVTSVLAQRGVSLELIAVDDHSRDEGPAYVHALAVRDPRVVPVASAQRGIVGALNIALSRARGIWIARMDADDVCEPKRFARQVEHLRASPKLAAVGTRVRGFPDESLGEGLRRYIDWLNAIVTPEDHRREIFVESPLCHPSVMLHREVLERVGAWVDTPWAEDYDLWLRLDAAGHALAKVPEVLVHWRHRAGRETFTNERYSLERLREARARYLAPRLRAHARPFVVWGAGPTGRRLARALEREGASPVGFIDVDPRKIGGSARGVAVRGMDSLRRGEHTVVVAVGARGARELIRADLVGRGFIEGDDFVCAS